MLEIKIKVKMKLHGNYMEIKTTWKPKYDLKKFIKLIFYTFMASFDRVISKSFLIALFGHVFGLKSKLKSILKYVKMNLNMIWKHQTKSTSVKAFVKLKGELSGLQQFLETEIHLKIMENAYYFNLKALFVLRLLIFLSFFCLALGLVEKQAD